MKSPFRSPLLCHVIFASALAALAPTPGCVSPPADRTYADGTLSSTLPAGLDQANRATHAALDDLGFTRLSETRDALTVTQVMLNAAADRRIEIKLETAGDSVTKIMIRVGVFGDEALSLAIRNKIKAKL